jgi:hypothetical protein
MTMEKVKGVLYVGHTEDTHEVIINHPGVGHIVFSPDQARNLARLLLDAADAAQAAAPLSDGVIRPGLFDRWYIFHPSDPRLAWSGSQWVPSTQEGYPTSGIQVCNFDDADEARAYMHYQKGSK